jgi:hypothetical protein
MYKIYLKPMLKGHMQRIPTRATGNRLFLLGQEMTKATEIGKIWHGIHHLKLERFCAIG